MNKEEDKQKTILIVDDEEPVIKTIAAWLKDYRCEGVLTVRDAVAKIKKDKPGLVLLDILLGDGNGMDVLKTIKAIDKQIPVVMVTGVHDNEEGQRAFDAGASDYITKPIDFHYLRKVIQSHLL